MRAMTFDQYGSNDVLQISEIADPPVGPDSVLIRTKAVGINPVDWKVVRGYLDSAFPTHFPAIPCWDVAGVVEAVGPAITEFRPGDEVVAYNRQDHVQFGTLSELVSAPRRCVGHKPAKLDWLRGGALPLAGLTAHQTVDVAQVQPGDTVVVHNASGGVGSAAVQLAARRGARVIGTASAKNHDYLTSIGAEPVAYGEGLENSLRELAPMGIDVCLDFIGGNALDVSGQLVGSSGRIVSIVDAKRVAELGGQYVFVHPDSAQLTELAALAATGNLNIEIASTFPFEKAADALAESETGHVRGKVVVEFTD
jgi:NADPH:quinone reductase-like Zn-dependent oxidoreductase